jgi:hemolysin D
MVQQTERHAAPGTDLHPDAIEVETRPPPRLARIVLYAVLAFIAIAITWAAVSKVDVIVTAQGRLITTAQTMVVQALETSVVRSIDVKVGQAVKKGEVIAKLDPTFSEADLTQTQQRLQSLAAEIARLNAELDGKRYAPVGSAQDDRLQLDLFERRTAEYRARLDGFRADLARNEADLEGTRKARKLLEERLASARQIEAMKTDLLARAVLSRVEVLEATERRLEVQQAAEDAASKESQLVQQVAQSRANLEAFTREWRQKSLDALVKTRRDHDALKEALNKAERRGELVFLTAPADAVVLEINRRTVGSVAREAEPILTLVPQGVPLEAEIQIPSEDIGFVRAGDPVKVKIDAFPFQKHGVIQGRLTVVGGDSIAVDETKAGRQSTRAYYPARVSGMDSSTLKRVPSDTQLVPGMTLTAEIRVGERTVISYFLYPLTKAFGESIREP